MSNIEGPEAFIVERAGYRKSGGSSRRELASAARAVNTEGRGIGAAAPSTVQSGRAVHGPTRRGDAGTRDLAGRTSSKPAHNQIITTRGGSSLGVSCSITHYLTAAVTMATTRPTEGALFPALGRITFGDQSPPGRCCSLWSFLINFHTAKL